MSKPRYEYQVSESATADRKYFTNADEALRTARELSRAQAHPVYIDVRDLWAEDLTDYWYTVRKGKLRKHADGKEVICSVLS